MPPPAKKERRERSERTEKERPEGEKERPEGEKERPEGEKERPEGEGEQASGEGRPEGERPDRVRPEGDTPEKVVCDIEQPIKDKPDREKDISPAVTKKPSSKKTRSVMESACQVSTHVCCAGLGPHTCLCSSRPKSDSHQSPPSDKQSIQSGKSTTKTNKNSHISRCVAPSFTLHFFGRTPGLTSTTTHHILSVRLVQFKGCGKPQMIHKCISLL